MKKTQNKDAPIKVGFTKAQHIKVHAFLKFMREGGQVERDLGGPIKVVVEWGTELVGFPAVIFTGSSGLQKVIEIKKILEADDTELKGPHLKLVPESNHGN